MTIKTKSYRNTEAMMTAAGLTSADILMTIIGLASETTTPTPDDEAAGVDPIRLQISALANRLEWEPCMAHALLRQHNAEALEELGFVLCDLDDDDPEFGPALTATASDVVTAIIRGTAAMHIEADDPRAMVVDGGSAAAVSLVARLADCGGGLLYREPLTANERVAALMAAAATLAADIAIAGSVVVHDRYTAGFSIPPVASVIGAVLHGARVVMIIEPIVVAPTQCGGDGADDEHEAYVQRRPTWSSLTQDGWRLAGVVPHVPCAVIVPIPHDVVLAPSAAANFVTAIGPLRRDRLATQRRLLDMADGRINGQVAEQLSDLWDGCAEHAGTSIEAVGRLIDGPARALPPYKLTKAKVQTSPKTTLVFSTMMEAMAGGIRPHVWAPIRTQAKPKAVKFHRELFVCEPDAGVLFSPFLKEEANIRIMLLGPPGTGKSGAAAHVAAAVLGMASHSVTMADVLHYRLGHLERAIAGAFREAREKHAVLILDEADSIAQDRATAGPGSVNLVTAITNALLLELDRHAGPVFLISNFAERIDPAVKRRFDLAYEVKAIPAELEARALRLLLDLETPKNFTGFGGDTAISDYVGAKRLHRLLGGGDEAALTAVRRARDIRLGCKNKGQRIGF